MGNVILNRLSEPFSITYETVEATIESTNWEASGISGVVQNDVVFGGTIITQTSVNYPVTFQDGIRGNDFANLPPQIFTWSSDATTGPITITKEVGLGEFTGKFKGSQIRVFVQGPAAVYVVTEVVDQNTLTAYYQAGPSQGNVITSLTQQFSGPNNTMALNFSDLNGTPDPNVQYFQAGQFEQQTNRLYSTPGFFKGASINRYFNIPANATSIVALNELPDPPEFVTHRGIRAYALIFDNKDAFISTSQGVRKIAKIENGNTFINIAGDYGTETWDQAGGDLQFITPFAMESVAANRATNTDWANAVPIDISTYTQVTLAFALDTFEDNQDAVTLGAQLLYESVVISNVAFDANDFFVLELNMDETTIGDAADIETAWANIKYYEVLGGNEIRFFAPANSVTDVPIIAKVIK
jgi:hypothetical protein